MTMNRIKLSKRFAYALMATGIAIWLLAVLVSTEPSLTFRVFVIVGWGMAFVGALLNAYVFLKERSARKRDGN
jgi:uncharacterized membrane protein